MSRICTGHKRLEEKKRKTVEKMNQVNTQVRKWAQKVSGGRSFKSFTMWVQATQQIVSTRNSMFRWYLASQRLKESTDGQITPWGRKKQIVLQQPSEGSTLPDVDQGQLPQDTWHRVRIWRMLYIDPRWQRHTKQEVTTWGREARRKERAWCRWGIISSLVRPEQQIWSQGGGNKLERCKSCLEDGDFILQGQEDHWRVCKQ